MENKRHKWYNEIVAWAEGKQIQFRNFTYQEWMDMNWTPSWNMNGEYRIKPEHQLIPFDYSDAKELIGKIVKNKNNESISIITQVGKHAIGVYGAGYLFDLFLEKYTFLDGSPCGKYIND